MGRPREFDRETALRAAVGVFWDHGYEAASTEQLTRVMGIGRQSLYDTFGDKHALFRDALALYNTERVAHSLARMRTAKSPLAGIEAELLAFARETKAERLRGCLGINSICELGTTDPEVTNASSAAGSALEAGLASVLDAAVAAREVRANLDTRAAARFVLSTLAGMRVQGRAGRPPEELAETAAFALASLKAR